MNAAREEGRLLVVDDELPLRELFAAILGEAGWQVDVAGSGNEALQLLGSRAYDAVLSDIDMPGMNGLQLLKAVRSRDLDLPVLLVTGYPQVESAVEALEQGAFRYLLKPVALDTLTEAVASAARLHRVVTLKRQILAQLGSDDRLLADHAGLQAAFEGALLSLRLVYQPIFRADGGAVFGYEALVRTSEPRLPHPGALFDAAERLHRVHELGRLIRARAAALLGRGAIPLAFVNVHPLELSDDDLLLPDAPLSRHARSVVLEITERQSIEGVPGLPARIKALRKLGYRLAIDDLGAGYAGLATFAVLEPDVVKLDMSLVRGCDHEPVKQPLIRSMAALCKELGALVVAEGIETPAERDTVVSLGCDLLQGFLLGRPAEVAEIGATPDLRWAAPIAPMATTPARTNLWLDASDTITAVDEPWLDFARANGAPELTRQAVVGRPLRDFIAEPEAIGLGDLLAAARARQTPVALPFRCDSPGERRFMTMTLRAQPAGGLHLEYHVDRAEARATVPLLDCLALRSEKIVYVCSWCRRVRHEGAWREAEQAIPDGERVPRVSHGICGDCASVLRASVLGGRPAG